MNSHDDDPTDDVVAIPPLHKITMLDGSSLLVDDANFEKYRRGGNGAVIECVRWERPAPLVAIPPPSENTESFPTVKSTLGVAIPDPMVWEWVPSDPTMTITYVDMAGNELTEPPNEPMNWDASKVYERDPGSERYFVPVKVTGEAVRELFRAPTDRTANEMRAIEKHLLDFPAHATQGREDTPYDRGFADGKKRATLRIAAAERLAEAVENYKTTYSLGDSEALIAALAAYRNLP